MKSLILGGLIAALVPAAALAQSSKQQLALNNVSGSQGLQLAGMTCSGVWEVDDKVQGGRFDFGAYRVKFEANGQALGGTWEGVPGKIAHDAPHAAHFQNASQLLRVAVKGDLVEITSKFPGMPDKGIRWTATMRQDGATVQLVGGRFSPKDARPDWSDGKFSGNCQRR